MAGVSAQVWGQRVVVGKPEWVLSQLPPGQAAAAAAAQLAEQLAPADATGGKLTQVRHAPAAPVCGCAAAWWRALCWLRVGSRPHTRHTADWRARACVCVCVCVCVC
jgi:hypothetical protein